MIVKYINNVRRLYPDIFVSPRTHRVHAQKYSGIEFLVPLLRDMIQRDPSKRPTIQEVVTRFDELVKPLGTKKQRSRLICRNQDDLDDLVNSVAHPFRRLWYKLTRKPAIPQPR